MTTRTCCRQATGWLAPTLGLALMPKCPACVAAYVAAITGVGISIPFATHVRLGLLIFCATALGLVAAKTAVRTVARLRGKHARGS